MATSSPQSSHQPRIIQWLLDTRPLWPVPRQSKPREEVELLKTVASRALSLLTPSEQASVLRYYHLRDAKMSLASHLLKHLIVTKYSSIASWKESVISRDAHGKPCFVPSDPEEASMDFNVSHQAGIVSLIAVVGVGEKDKVEVGTDVVCWNERLVQDYAHIEKEGFFEWVDIHRDVFAESEISYMKLGPVEFGLNLTGFGKDAVSRCQRRHETVSVNKNESPIMVESNLIIDLKLRRFYACWCLREAYVKMTGEALLAPWLKELEISDVKSPAAKTTTSTGHLSSSRESLEDGEIERDFTIHFKGKPVTDVKMELVALGEDYMIGGAVRPATKLGELGLQLGKWDHLDLESDILAFAES